MSQLQGKVAIVTGGGNGFGEGIVKLYAKEGAKVVIADINKEAADRVAAEIGDAALAATEAHAAAFWAIRDAPGEYGRLIPGRVSFDVSFSIADVGEAARRCDERLRAQWPDAHILIYGHLGDGNLHIVVQQPDWPASAAAEVKLVVYGVTAEMNGSVSAEHGIGTKKLDVLALSRSPAELATMRALKAALDPRGILNPGKLFAS